MLFDPVYKQVHCEGCDLSYCFQGQGPLLILVPGGGALGKTFYPIFEYLTHRFTVCTLDRRQYGLSKVQGVPRTMNPSQQARDLVTIMKDMGFSKTTLFGNSGGAIIALQFAAIYPQYLTSVIAHEAPTSCLLPDVETIHDQLFAIAHKSQTEGYEAAYRDFRGMQKGFEEFPQRVRGSKADVQNFFDNEYLGFLLYCPDLRRIAKNKVPVAVAAGLRTEDAFYGRTAREQRHALGCEYYDFPGNHAGFELEPEAFAKKLVMVLDDLEPSSGSVVSTTAK